jgi:diguanylate cyclase (GGDEF)-like protein
MLGLMLAATLTLEGRPAALPQSGGVEYRVRIDGPVASPLRLHFTQYVDRVEATIPLANGSDVMAVAGTAIPYNARAAKTIDPMIPLPAAMAVPATIELRVHAEDLRFATPVLETNYPENPVSEPDAFYILTVGLLLGIALYHAMLFIALRDRNVGLYVLYLFGFILYEMTASGLAWRELWPFASIPAIGALRVVSAIVALAVTAFARSFMRTAKNAPPADRVLLGAIALTLVATIVGAVAPATLAISAIVADVGLLLSILACTACAIICWRRRVRSAMFFFIGFTGLFIGAIVKILVDDFGGIQSSAHFYGIELGVCFDSIVLAFGIADRMRLDTRARERAQATAAEQERLALTDALTGIANRRQFDARLGAEWNRAVRQKTPLAIVMLDIDRFKLYNDASGHGAGDECLQLVATTANALAQRADEVFARYGGEEFAMILPGCTVDGATVIAQRIVQAVRDLNLTHPAGGVLTLSAGVAAYEGGPFVDHAVLVADADAALYRAKASGGDCVMV